MTEEHTPYSEEYRRVRETFDQLELSSQARFLIEATAATIGRGIDAIAKTMAEDIEEAFGPHAAHEPEAGSTEENGGEEGETAADENRRDES